MVGWFWLMVSWFWLMVSWLGFMVSWFWFMVSWCWFHIVGHGMSKVMSMVHHVGHVRILLHVVARHADAKDLLKAERVACMIGMH